MFVVRRSQSDNNTVYVQFDVSSKVVVIKKTCQWQRSIDVLDITLFSTGRWRLYQIRAKCAGRGRQFTREAIA
jgi:hypothetical protein